MTANDGSGGEGLTTDYEPMNWGPMTDPRAEG
jgi:hypothetical protein